MTHPPSTLKGAKSVARSHTRPSRPRKHEKTCKKEAVGGGDCHQPAVGTIKTCPHVSHVPVPAHQPAHTPQPSPRSSSRGASTHACVTVEFGVCSTVPAREFAKARWPDDSQGDTLISRGSEEFSNMRRAALQAARAAPCAQEERDRDLGRAPRPRVIHRAHRPRMSCHHAAHPPGASDPAKMSSTTCAAVGRGRQGRRDGVS